MGSSINTWKRERQTSLERFRTPDEDLECLGLFYWKPQAVGGPLRGLDDDVHPEVKPLPLGGMVHYLLFKPLNQLQVLHNRPKVPEGGTHKLMY